MPAPHRIPGSAAANQARVEDILFWCLSGLFLVPLALGCHTLTQDGPAHLYNARLLADFWNGESLPAARFLQLRPGLTANWLDHVVLAALQCVLPGWVAEKLLQGAFVLGFPLACRYALRQFTPEASLYALLGFPLVYNTLFLNGFYNQCFGFVLLLCLAGKWLAVDYRFTARAVAGLAALGTGVYVAHPLTFVVGAMFVAALVADRYFNPAGRGSTVPLVRTLAVLCVMFMPALILLFWFWLQNQGRGPVVWPGHPLVLLRQLVFLGNAIERPAGSGVGWMARAMAVVLGWLAWRAAVHVRGARPAAHALAFGLLLSLLTLLYLVMPERLLGGYIVRPRLGFLWWLAGLLAVAALSAPSLQPARRWRQVVFGGLAAGFGLAHISAFAARQPVVDQVAALRAHVPAGAIVLPYTVVNEDLDGPHAWSKYFRHVSQYVCLGRDIVCLENYEAEQLYFPLRWKAGFVPETGLIISQVDTAGKLSIAEVERRVPAPPTHVLVLGAAPSHPVLVRRGVAAHLARHFRLVFASPDRRAWVYARRKATDRQKGMP